MKHLKKVLLTVPSKECWKKVMKFTGKDGDQFISIRNNPMVKSLSPLLGKNLIWLGLIRTLGLPIYLHQSRRLLWKNKVSFISGTIVKERCSTSDAIGEP